ncbi:redoxin family protein [Rubripirellula amarantea]|nr:redoxin family protein [Rubripirellula amarantea]
MMMRFSIAVMLTLCTALTIATAEDEQVPVRQGPRMLNGSTRGIGKLMPNAKLVDLAGKTHSLSDLTSRHQAVVIAMTSTSCPLSKRYLSTLRQLVKQSNDDVAWLLVNPVATDERAAMQAAASSFRSPIIYAHDPEGSFASAVGAVTTTDTIVLDASRTVVYHGAIDDQYGFGYSIDSPRHRYLADALTAVETGQAVSVKATDAPGCVLTQNHAPRASTQITYHNRVSRIMQQRCQNCHRDGGVAPFALTTFAEVEAHSAMIEQVVRRGIMPPWFASDSASDTDQLSPWSNDCSLEEGEKRDLLEWLDGSLTEGDPNDAPQPLIFTSEWEIGEPDAVFQFAEPQVIKATGVMPYQNVVIDTHLDEDKWVQAIEVRPGDRSVVHHVIVFANRSGGSSDERDGFWGVYVPGNSSLIYPEGFAKRLPKNAKLHFQMHYTPNGTATTDQTSIGVIYAKAPPRHEVRVAGIINEHIAIPPGASNHAEVATLRVPGDARVMGFLPHMHLRGNAARYELIRDGSSTTMLDIPRYDFNWQLLYRYRDPIAVSLGDKIRFTSWYDNSNNNPANPDSSKTVYWGQQTYDEMQVGYVEYYVPGEKPELQNAGDTAPSSSIRPASSMQNKALFRRLDLNRDGVITKQEVRQALPDDPHAAGPVFDRIDVDQDGKVTRAELSKLNQ